MAQGSTIITNPNRGADVIATYAALRQLGVRVVKRAGAFIVQGGNIFCDPRCRIECGNSGTTMRLLTGVLAGRVNAVLDGDGSLRRRPMERVVRPLRRMGAKIESSAAGTAPLRIFKVARQLNGITYRLPVASAQLKSALLLAGLGARAQTLLVCPEQSRDHTERMLGSMGARISVKGAHIRLHPSRLTALGRLAVPGDFSAAFYLIAAAATLPGMRLRLRNVGLNPTRTGALSVLQEMGAQITLVSRVQRNREPIGDIVVSGGAPLHGVVVEGAAVPNLLDEIPALCAVAAVARGNFQVRGAAELTVKESDRISTTVQLLRAFKADAHALPDGISVCGGRRLRAPRSVTTHGDHRIGMAAAILAVASRSAIEIRNSDCIATSYPKFAASWRAAFG